MTQENMTLVIVGSGIVAEPNSLTHFVEVLITAFPGIIHGIIGRTAFIWKHPLSDRLLITQLILESPNKEKKKINRIIKDLLTQLKISLYLLTRERYADTYIFFLGQSLMLPILILKLIRRRIILPLGASYLELAKYSEDRLLIFPKIEERISCMLADRIVVYSESLINQWGLNKYKDKISIAHEHFLNFDKFKVEKQLNERNGFIGYIGRLSEEKGVLNFMEAIPKILEIESGVKIFIGGDGQLRGKVEQYLKEKNLDSKVQFTGWIPHDELPKYLNELKLLVLPSYTEGLPNIMLESMACGTPVLATSVGAIPDIIKDNETGFIIENNSPECIAKNIIRVLNHPNLEQIAQNARALVEKEFTFEKTVERWRKILEEL